MAQLAIGIILVLCFVAVGIAAVVVRPLFSPTQVLLLGAVLIVPGIALIVSGRRRAAIFRKAGPAVIAAARGTGHIDIADIAAQTETEPDKVRQVVTILVGKGIIPRDVEVS